MRPGLLSRASQQLRERDIDIYAIGLSPNTPEDELKDITSDTEKTFLYAVDELPRSTPQILSRWYHNWLSKSHPKGNGALSHNPSVFTNSVGRQGFVKSSGTPSVLWSDLSWVGASKKVNFSPLDRIVQEK